MSNSFNKVVAISLLFCVLGAGAQETEPRREASGMSSANDSADKYAVFDSVAADGSNLRQVLASLDIATFVIPLGANITFVHVDSGTTLLLRGGILDSKMIEFTENLPRICRGEWIEDVPQKDIMSDRIQTIKRTISADRIKNYFPRSSAYGWKKASCGDAFVFRGSAQDSFIYHRVGQPFIWKNNDLLEPKGKDDLPPDGPVNKSWFKPGDRYPSLVETIAWASRICELRGGNLSLAFYKEIAVSGRWEKQPIVIKKIEEMIDEKPKDYFLHCDSGVESFLIRKYVATEKSAIFTNTFEVERMAIQRNRDLKSVGF
jgi:hypothetical protein